MLEYGSLLLLIILLFIIVLIFYSSVTITITDSNGETPSPAPINSKSRPNATIFSQTVPVPKSALATTISNQDLLDSTTATILSAMFPKFYYDNSQIVKY